jgi:glycosyltransferase involved in cell wall biosynthesis
MSSKEILVSIIIPCHNVSDYIEECINSAYEQTYKNIEVVAIDNNSSDKTYIKLEQLKQSKYPNLIVLQELKKGACAARNKGLSVVQGEWIQFLDADDLLQSEKIKHQVNLIENCKSDNVAFVSGAYFSQNSEGTIYKTTTIGTNHPVVNVFVRESGNTCSNLFSIIWLQKVNGWDLALTSSQETDLMLRLVLKGGQVIIDNTPLTIIRERDSGQISQSNPTKRWFNIVQHRLKYLNDIEATFSKDIDYSKSDVISFIVSAIIILGKFDKKQAVNFAQELKKYKKTLIPKYGLTTKTIFLIKIIGLQTFLKIR